MKKPNGLFNRKETTLYGRLWCLYALAKALAGRANIRGNHDLQEHLLNKAWVFQDQFVIASIAPAMGKKL
jgi:hypothetical protein